MKKKKTQEILTPLDDIKFKTEQISKKIKEFKKEIDELKFVEEANDDDMLFYFNELYYIKHLSKDEIKKILPAVGNTSSNDNEGWWIILKKDRCLNNTSDTTINQLIYSINRPRIEAGTITKIDIDFETKKACVLKYCEFIKKEYNRLIKLGNSMLDDAKYREDFLKSHFAVNYDGFEKLEKTITDKTDDLLMEGKEQLVTELVNVFNNHYKGFVDEKVLQVIDRILDLCEVEQIRKRGSVATEAVIDSIEKVHIIETFLRETATIEDFLTEKYIQKAIWGAVVSKMKHCKNLEI